MVLKIQKNGLLIRSSIINLLHQKMNKLSRLYNKIIAIKINFKSENCSINKNKICEIRLIIPSYDFIASAKCETFEEAVSKTSEALERQIEKRKTKLKRESLNFII